MNTTASTPGPGATPQTPARDRRRHVRFGVARPAKVFRRAAQRYEAAASCDLSFGGARLEVRTGRAFEVGEIIDLGVALRDDALLRSPTLLRAVVLRARPLGPDRHEVALRYIHRDPVALAA